MFGYYWVLPICIGCLVLVLLGTDMVVGCMCIQVAIPRLLSLEISLIFLELISVKNRVNLLVCDV